MKKNSTLNHFGAFFTLLVVALAVFIASYLKLPPYLVGIIGAISTVSYPTYQRLMQIANEIKKERKRKETLKEFTKEVRDGLDKLKVYPEESFSSGNIDEKLERENLNLNRSSFYEKAIEVGLDGLSNNKKKVVLTLVVVNTLENKELSQNIESKLRKLIENIISSYNIRSPGNEENELISGFRHYESDNIENFSNTKHIFARDVEEEEITRELLRISDKYGKGSHIAMSILEDKKKVEEFHSTLSKLIKRGKLRLEGVEKDIKNLREREVEDSSFYLVFVQKLQYSEKFKEKLSEYPHINFGTLNPKNNFPGQYQYLSTFMISSPVTYGTPKEFLENEFKTVFSDADYEDKFIAILSLETEEVVTEGSPAYREEIKGALDYLKGDSDALTYEIISQRVRKEVEISEILSSIPFNILVPDMKEDEKDVIINNYKSLKSFFAIEDLFDWAERNPKEIADKINELDNNNTASKERWGEITKQIVEEAEKCDRAAFNSLNTS